MTKPKKVALWGISGSGKTYLAQKLAKEITGSSNTRLVVIDPYAEGDFHERGEDAAQALYDGARAVALRTSSPFEALPLLYAATFASTEADPILIILDEAADYLNEKRQLCKSIFNQCRHNGLSIFVASQRPASVHPDYRAQCAETYFLKLADQRDIEVARGQIGPKAALLSTFETGQFVKHPPDPEPTPTEAKP